jgi:hypothetical protein
MINNTSSNEAHYMTCAIVWSCFLFFDHQM